MAAPSPTARGTPGGLPLRDGFGTLITFVDNATVNLWEKASTPSGQDIGDAINTSTFHNTRMTKWPRTLIEDTDGSFTCAYDPLARTQLESLVGVNQEITITFNDGSTWAFWGFMKSFIPQEASDGEQPEAAVEFVITNTDDTFLEQGPVVNEVGGS